MQADNDGAFGRHLSRGEIIDQIRSIVPTVADQDARRDALLLKLIHKLNMSMRESLDELSDSAFELVRMVAESAATEDLETARRRVLKAVEGVNELRAAG